MKRSAIIVGAGVIGCALAHELAQAGVDVTVIDSAEAGSGTSAATFAWVNSNNKKPAEYNRLNMLGMEAHERSARASEGGRRWFHQDGTVHIAQSEQEMGVLEGKVEQFQANDYESKMLTASEVLELEPALDASKPVGGALYSKEGWVDVQTMCLTRLMQAINLGARFAPYERVVEVQPTLVKTATRDGSSRTHRADVVILTAGNGNRGILAQAGIDFPTLATFDESGDGTGARATVGIISTTGPINAEIKHMVQAEGIALRPARNGGITFADNPTGGKWEFDDPRLWTVSATLLDHARELYPFLKSVSTEAVSLGTRVLPVDGVTIADWVTQDQSIYAIATHSGVTLSAHLARAVSQEVVTGIRDESLQLFGMSRFAPA